MRLVLLYNISKKEVDLKQLDMRKKGRYTELRYERCLINAEHVDELKQEVRACTILKIRQKD